MRRGVLFVAASALTFVALGAMPAVSAPRVAPSGSRVAAAASRAAGWRGEIHYSIKGQSSTVAGIDPTELKSGTADMVVRLTHGRAQADASVSWLMRYESLDGCVAMVDVKGTTKGPPRGFRIAVRHGTYQIHIGGLFVPVTITTTYLQTGNASSAFCTGSYTVAYVVGVGEVNDIVVSGRRRAGRNATVLSGRKSDSGSTICNDYLDPYFYGVGTRRNCSQKVAWHLAR